MAVSNGGRFKHRSARFIFAAVLSVLILGPAKVWAGIVFYQPLLRDKNVSTEQWLQILSAAQQQGMTELALQWGQHGEVKFFDPQGPSAALFSALQQLKIPLWLGLYADPAYFKKIDSVQAEKQAYFKQQMLLSLQVRRHWLSLLKQQPLLQLKGWYLPMELNDTDFVSASYLTWLSCELKGLSEVLDKPVAISLYFNGKVPVKNWLESARQLQSDRLQLWVQDGAGAALVSEPKRQELLQQLPCTIPLIREQFRQSSKPGEVFQARALTEAEKQTQADSCHPVIYFELRYMSAAAGKLPLTDPQESVITP
jgi:hypothetical protein